MSFPGRALPVEGAWTRQSVPIDSSEPFETQLAYWLRSASVYADGADLTGSRPFDFWDVHTKNSTGLGLEGQ